MYTPFVVVVLGLLSIAHATVTVTVSINTGTCPATSSSRSLLSSTTTTSSSSTTNSGSSSSSSTTSSSTTSSTTTTPITTTTPSTTSTTTTTTAEPTPTQGSACPCPATSSQYTDSQGLNYSLECDETFGLIQGPGASFQPTFDACLVACDYYYDANGYCSGVTYAPLDPENGNNCFLTTNQNASQEPVSSEAGACVALFQN